MPWFTIATTEIDRRGQRTLLKRSHTRSETIAARRVGEERQWCLAKGTRQVDYTSEQIDDLQVERWTYRRRGARVSGYEVELTERRRDGLEVVVGDPSEPAPRELVECAACGAVWTPERWEAEGRCPACGASEHRRITR
jgi:hypothetical protein